MSADVDALRQTDIFAGVADEHLAALANRVQHRVYEAEATIFAEDDPGDAVFVIASGGVRLSKDTATNRKITLALLGEGDTFGELALFDSAPRSATAVAVERTVCLSLMRSAFLEVLDAQPAVVQAMLHGLARVIRRMNERLGDAAMLDVRERVSRALLSLADRFGRETPDGIVIDRVVTEEDLASEAGLYPTDVARVVRDLRDADVLRREGAVWLVHRPEALRRGQ